MSDDAFYRMTELDRANWPEVREQILSYEHHVEDIAPRSYPGYPCFALDRVVARLWPSLDRVLRDRRCPRKLDVVPPSRKTLSRLLRFSHGVHESMGRGPIPSAGGLQCLELYLVSLIDGWLPAGLYHYDRVGHHLAQLAAGAERVLWHSFVPSLSLVEGGSLLWVVVGDGARMSKKYGARGYRFLLLEAGHLMQNLCLMSASVGWSTVPLGAFFEAEVTRAFRLPTTDVVAYLGVVGSN